MKSKSNNIGVQQIVYINKEMVKTLIIGNLFAIIYVFFTSISMSKWDKFFYAVSPLLIIMFFFMTIYSPIIMLIRVNNTINSLEIGESMMKLTTNRALWFKPKKSQIKFESIKLLPSNFVWYGKEKREGIIIRTIDKREYYLVKDFFDEYDEILKKLNSMMISEYQNK